VRQEAPGCRHWPPKEVTGAAIGEVLAMGGGTRLADWLQIKGQPRRLTRRQEPSATLRRLVAGAVSRMDTFWSLLQNNGKLHLTDEITKLQTDLQAIFDKAATK
jgi:hypothetical protein